MKTSSTQLDAIRKAMAATAAHQRRAEALLKTPAERRRKSDKPVKEPGSPPNRAKRGRRKGGEEA
jgi:hypothetical protein